MGKKSEKAKDKKSDKVAKSAKKKAAAVTADQLAAAVQPLGAGSGKKDGKVPTPGAADKGAKAEKSAKGAKAAKDGKSPKVEVDRAEKIDKAEKRPDSSTKRVADPSRVTGSIVEALRVDADFRLSDVATDATPGFSGGKEAAEAVMSATADEIAELQERLYAESRGGGNRSVLLVIQGLDTSGKGGIMRHVVGLLDPQGVAITAFKAPTPEERRHPFLWRIRKGLPSAGMIGVFDRSHYEDVLVPRVDSLVPVSTWRRRFSQIRTFENTTSDSGTRIVKIMLHIGRDEQKDRLAERLARPDKHWKYNPGDIDTRLKWDAYQEAYAEAIEKTSTDTAPWFVVPADHKWYARLAVQQILLDVLRDMDPQWPAADFDVEVEKQRLAES